MWFAHDSLQPGVPAFDMIICSRPIVVIVVPLFESELAVDPGAVKVGDEVATPYNSRVDLVGS